MAQADGIVPLRRSRRGLLAHLSPETAEELLVASIRVQLPAGGVFRRPGDAPHAELLESGLIRYYFSEPSGRQTTVNFVRPGELAGLSSLLSQPIPYFAEAVVASQVRVLDLERASRLTGEDPKLAKALLRLLSEQVMSSFQLISLRTLGDIRQRLAWDLLERSYGPRTAAGRQLIPVTHSELALSMGTSREVVTRALSALARSGLVRSYRGQIEIANVGGLAAIVSGFD